MKDLIERVEAATEGSRELDAEIYWHLAPANCRDDTDDERWVVDPDFWNRLDEGPPMGRPEDDSPPYTTSLDAALQLVPEGWAIEDWMIWPAYPSSLRLLETALGREEKYWHSHPMQRLEGKAATPALALVAAALRAREN